MTVVLLRAIEREEQDEATASYVAISKTEMRFSLTEAILRVCQTWLSKFCPTCTMDGKNGSFRSSFETVDLKLKSE